MLHEQCEGEKMKALVPKGFKLIARTDHRHSICDAFFHPEDKKFFFRIFYAPDEREWCFGPIPAYPGLFECIMITFKDVTEAKGRFTYIEVPE